MDYYELFIHIEMKKNILCLQLCMAPKLYSINTSPPKLSLYHTLLHKYAGLCACTHIGVNYIYLHKSILNHIMIFCKATLIYD